MRFAPYASACLAALAAGQAMAVDATMSPQGYTGLSITPTARRLGWGDMSLSYDRQLPGAPRPDGHNFIAGFGLLPGIEASGRIASNKIHCNHYQRSDCGIRDLSANVKAGLGFGADDAFAIAVGATDLGGAATNFRSYYGVGTFDAGKAQVSLGLANRAASRTGAGRSPLHGVFASAAYQPLPWLQGHVEYSDRNAWAGAKVFAPKDWLPDGWQAYAGLTARLVNKNEVTERAWWNVGIGIPLYNVPRAGARRSDAAVDGPSGAAGDDRSTAVAAAAVPDAATPPRPIEASTPPALAATPASPSAAPAGASASSTPLPVPDSRLNALAAALKAKGLEDISVGRLPDGAVAIAVNNGSYDWNVLDAAGAALGAVARELASTRIAYRLIVTQRQAPIVALSGRTDCLKDWIAGANGNCTAAELHTPGMMSLSRLHDGVAWVVRKAAPAWRTLRVGLEPVLQSNVATEYGVFDYSVGLGVNLQQPLWGGASLDLRYVAPLGNSSDFEADAAFAARHVRAGVDRALFSQTLRLPPENWSAVSAQVNLGKVSRNYNGVHGELRWEPGEGRHRFGAEGGYFKHRDGDVAPLYGPERVEPRTSRPLLGSYRYHHLPTDTFLEFSGGQFINHDRGAQVALRQWFGDTAVAVYYKRTRFQDEQQSASFVGLEVSLPLGPRRDSSVGSFLQVGGTPRWSYGVQTLSGRDNNNITTGHAVRPGLPGLNETFNADRAGVGYFENYMDRIREAAR